jgi:hypothetical protein
MPADLGRLAKHCASLNTQSDEAATPESTITNGLDALARQAAKVTLGLNPDLKDQGVIPWETNVGSGFSIPPTLKDLPGGLLASLSKYFTRELLPGLMPSEPVEVSFAELGDLRPMETPGMERERELGV